MGLPWDELTKQPIKMRVKTISSEKWIDIKIFAGCLPIQEEINFVYQRLFSLVCLLKRIDLSLSCFITTLPVSVWQQVGWGRECEWGLERERQTLYTWDVFLLMSGAAVLKLPQRSYHHSGGSRVGWVSWRGGVASLISEPRWYSRVCGGERRASH